MHVVWSLELPYFFFKPQVSIKLISSNKPPIRGAKTKKKSPASKTNKQ